MTANHAGTRAFCRSIAKFKEPMRNLLIEMNAPHRLLTKAFTVVDCDVVIAWPQLPFYAIRSIRRALAGARWPAALIATPGPCNEVDAERAIPAPIRWVRDGCSCTWETLGVSVPKVFCYTGDFDPVRRWWRRDVVASGFDALARAVRENGGKTICMIDNNCKSSVRQAVGGAVFRFVLREHRNIDAVFVPGIDGFRLMRQFGFSERKIRQGLYGADPGIFRPGPPLDQRPRDFLFAGQLIKRKGIVTLLKAVTELRAESVNYSLAALGSGPMEAALRSAGIPVLGFCPPDTVAEEMRKTKFLVLPSYEEHWGVVVHEAALSGCGLILSDAIGSRHDLLTQENGFLCKVRDSASLASAMRFALSLNKAGLDRCRQVSANAAANFGPEKFAETLRETVETLMSTDHGPVWKSLTPVP